MMPIGSRGRAAQGAAGYRRGTGGGDGGGDGGSSGDYEAPEHDWYGPAWRDPPTRSNTAYVSDFSSVTDALSNVAEDTTLYLDTGPYSGSTFQLETSHVTVSGEGYSNAEFHHDFGNKYMFTTRDWNLTQQSCDSIAPDDTVITGINDTSIFSVGDDVRLWDNDQIYDRGNPGGSGSNDEGNPSQFVEVAAVNSSSVEINPPAELTYNSTPEIHLIDWGLEDIHLTHFEAHGDGREGTSDSRYRLISISQAKDAWMTDLSTYDIYGMGMAFYRTLNAYSDRTLSNGTRFYGIQASSGTTNAHIHNHIGVNLARYAAMTGMGANGGAYYVRMYDCESYGCAATHDAHFGPENVKFYDAYATGDPTAYENYSDGNSNMREHNGNLHRLRGHDQHGIRGHVDVVPTDDSRIPTASGENLTHAQQWPDHIRYEGLTSNDQDRPRHGIRINSSASSWSLDRVEVIDCDLHGGYTPFKFRTDISELYLRDYYWNGNLVTRSDVENADGYSSYNINIIMDNS